MSLLAKVEACRRHDLAGLVPFQVAGERVGLTEPAFARALLTLGGAFEGGPAGNRLKPALASPEERTKAVERDLRALEAKGLVKGWRGEHYPVLTEWGRPEVFRVERAAAARLGTKAFGVHVNAWVRTDGEPHLWVALRSRSRPHAPGKLDHLVAGGQPAGLTLEENLVKECAEEAGMPAALARHAVPQPPFAYLCSLPDGLRDDTLFVYDLEVPAEFEPRAVDGEVERFYLRPASWVRERLRKTDDFKFNVGPCILGWLLRHGVIGPNEPEHAALVQALRPFDGAPRVR
jgi:hypothetical protein